MTITQLFDKCFFNKKKNSKLEMSFEDRLNQILENFESKTAGILGCSVISTSQALTFAEVSSHFDEGVIHMMSSKFLTLAVESLTDMFPDPDLKSVIIEEENHFVYVRKVNQDYHVVVITDKTEMAGLREMNIKSLIEKLLVIL